MAHKPAPAAYASNHGARRIQCLRAELKSLRKQYRTDGEVEKAGLADLCAIPRKDLRTLRRAEGRGPQKEMEREGKKETSIPG